MVITFLTNSIGFAGAEKMMAFVANSLAERGHMVSVINFNSFGSYLSEQTQVFQNSISVYSYSKDFKGNIRRLSTIIFALKQIKKINPDVLVCFTTFPNYVGKIVGSLLHIPSIMSERGDPNITINKKNPHSLLELLIINQSEGAVFQIKGAAEFYSKKLQKRGTIIPNPIYCKGIVEDIPISNRNKSVVSVGRLDNFQKRYDIMIQAFAIFSKQHPEYTLKLYGEGVDKQRIMHWAEELGVLSKIQLMGLSKNPMADICREGIFLITSDFEGISNSLLEAMAVGLPCVSTDSTPGGARMLISNRENGLLCPIQNPTRIAAALCEFAENPLLAEKCGRSAKEVTRDYAPSKLIALWEQYIKNVINEYN